MHLQRADESLDQYCDLITVSSATQIRAFATYWVLINQINDHEFCWNATMDILKPNRAAKH